MAKCEYVQCLKDSETIRTVEGPDEHTWQVHVCERHANELDRGLPMTVYVYAQRDSEAA